jgi:hypothetical protein
LLADRWLVVNIAGHEVESDAGKKEWVHAALSDIQQALPTP